MNAIFLGGDLRQKYACELLNNNNIYSEFYDDFLLDNIMKDKIAQSSIVVFPIPTIKNEIFLNNSSSTLIKFNEIITFINNNSLVFGGKLSQLIKNIFTDLNLSYVDLFDIESFQIQNALLSAEGAIYYAKQRFDRSIHGSKIAVLGFGRIGKILSYLLHSQGAKITVCARKDSDYTWSRVIGFDGYKIKISDDRNNLSLINNEYDIIFNTIPHWIIEEDLAKRINPNTIIIDIASHPYGIDERLIKKYNLQYYRELGIPGRYAPKSAGEIIGKTIINYIFAREE